MPYNACMKFIITKTRNTICQMNLIEDEIVYNSNHSNNWDQAVTDCADELSKMKCARRMAYNQWWWDADKEEEMNQFITFFNLKYV